MERLVFLRGVNVFNNRNIAIKNVLKEILMTKVVPIILIIAGILFSGESILDYTVNDYKTNKGVLRNINVPYRYILTEEFFVEGERDPYYLPKSLIKSEKNGKAYEYIYASRIILETHELKN